MAKQSKTYRDPISKKDKIVECYKFSIMSRSQFKSSIMDLESDVIDKVRNYQKVLYIPVVDFTNPFTRTKFNVKKIKNYASNTHENVGGWGCNIEKNVIVVGDKPEQVALAKVTRYKYFRDHRERTLEDYVKFIIHGKYN